MCIVYAQHDVVVYKYDDHYAWFCCFRRIFYIDIYMNNLCFAVICFLRFHLYHLPPHCSFCLRQFLCVRIASWQRTKKKINMFRIMLLYIAHTIIISIFFFQFFVFVGFCMLNVDVILPQTQRSSLRNYYMHRISWVKKRCVRGRTSKDFSYTYIFRISPGPFPLFLWCVSRVLSHRFIFPQLLCLTSLFILVVYSSHSIPQIYIHYIGRNV